MNLHKNGIPKAGSIFVMLILALLPMRGYAQEKKLSLNKENAGIEEILKEIQKQTGLNYLLNHEEIPAGTKVTVRVENASIDEVLKMCLKNLNLDFKIIDHVIIITPGKKFQTSSLTQTIKGKVFDNESHSPLIGATIVVIGTNPLLGTATGPDGYFKISAVPVGRYDVQIRCIGYEPLIIPEVLITSAKEVVIDAGMKQAIVKLEDVTVKAYSRKDRPVNSMASISARSFTVEETRRYAGGFDDPARLASAFAGVTTGEINNNGIVIRGNAPKGLLWRLEGIEIPNPNHFTGLAMIGGGGVSALSSLMLSNSDFLTGAFPAEYGNAMSGVFDIRLRTGNNENYEHAFQAGVMGLDLSSEGPFSAGGKASYLFNYRYSTFAIIQHVLPDYIPDLRYQDFCFKLNFPTEKAGIFSLWGLGYLDKQDAEIKLDTAEWRNSEDQEMYETAMNMGVIGMNHRYILGTKTYIHSSAALSGESFQYDAGYYDYSLTHYPLEQIENRESKINFASTLNYKFSRAHTNRTGIIISYTNYITDIKYALATGDDLLTIVDENGASMICQFFSQSGFNLGSRLTSNIGFHSQYINLNKEFVVEPRIGISYNFSDRQSISLAYGKHSRLEPLYVYFAGNTEDNVPAHPDRHLKITKAHHFVFAYDLSINPDLRLKIEPYFQYLYDVPVIPDSSYSTINLERDLYITHQLSNNGTGTNIGIDVTLERFLKDGYYYLITASIFDSKYKGGDKIERNTRYNSNFVFNFLVGREWIIGAAKNKLLSLSGRLNIIGGQWTAPVIRDYPYQQGDAVLYDYSDPFSYRKPHVYNLNASVNYRVNKRKYAGVWTIQVLNVLGRAEQHGYVYDYKAGKIVEDKAVIVVPSISYKIEF